MTEEPKPEESPETDSDQGGQVDRTFSVLSIAGFSLSLGAAGLVMPLVALASGYDLAAVGVLAAISAVSQLGFRLLLPWLLTRFSDRDLIVAAEIMMVGSFALLVVSRELPAFVLAQLLQGGARALFWTASQTHAVRGSGGVVRSLAMVQAVGNVGQLIGPVVAGIVAAESLDLALIVCGVAAAVGLVSGFAMTTLPTFPKQVRHDGQRIWRRPGVDVACWASYSAGGWRAMLSSYVPVALAAAGQPPQVIGVLMMVAEGTGVAASGLLLRRRPLEVGTAIQLAVLIVTASLIAFPFVAANAAGAGLALALGGLGSGLLMSLGPALATQSVSVEERGEAIAVAGTFRAVALLVTPGVTAAALTVVSLPVGLVVAALAIGVPPIAAALRRTPAPASSSG